MKITIDMVAKELEVAPSTVRKMIDRGELPIAAVTKDGNRKKYIILPKALYEETGIKVDGFEPPPSINVKVNYEKLAEEVAKTLVCGMAKIFGKEVSQ